MFGTRSPVVRSPNHAPQEPGSNGSAAPPFNTPDESPRHSLGSVTSLTSPRVLSPPARPLPSTLDEDPPSREDVDGFQEVLSSAHHPPIAPPRLSKGVASWMLAEIRPTSDPPRVTVYSRESSDSDERLLSFGARSNGQDFRPEPLQSVQHVASPTMDEPRALRERLAAEAARAAALEDKVQALEKHKVPRPHPPCASTSALNQRQAGSGRGVSGQTVGSPSGQILARARRSNISSRSRGSCGARKSARRRCRLRPARPPLRERARFGRLNLSSGAASVWPFSLPPSFPPSPSPSLSRSLSELIESLRHQNSRLPTNQRARPLLRQRTVTGRRTGAGAPRPGGRAAAREQRGLVRSARRRARDRG